MRYVLLALVFLAGCAAQPHATARVLFSTWGEESVTRGTAARVGPVHYVTVPHVMVGDRVRVCPSSANHTWLDAKVIAVTPTWCLIRTEVPSGLARLFFWDGYRDGDSGSPVIRPDGLLVGLVEGTGP